MSEDDGMLRLGSQSPYEAAFGYARVVRSGPWISVAGTTGIDARGAVVGLGDPYLQAKTAIANVATALERAGSNLRAVVRTRMYVVDRADAEAVGRAHGEAFGQVRPVSTLVVVAGLIDPAMRFEIEAEAYDTRAEVRTGHGFDAHRLVEGRPFVLGGVRVPFERGPLGHSDADALCHAVSDAILGACALGDLGTHFKDSDARWAGADSIVLLERCNAMARKAGYTIRSLDATVVVQAPKLAPHIEAMRARLAAATGLPVDRVSVKAKTSEGMGYTGDGSGIAAYAVATAAASWT